LRFVRFEKYTGRVVLSDAIVNRELRERRMERWYMSTKRTGPVKRRRRIDQGRRSRGGQLRRAKQAGQDMNGRTRIENHPGVT